MKRKSLGRRLVLGGLGVALVCTVTSQVLLGRMFGSIAPRGGSSPFRPLGSEPPSHLERALLYFCLIVGVIAGLSSGPAPSS